MRKIMEMGDCLLSKQGLLYLIAQMPNDINVFTTYEGDRDEINIKIFLKSKTRKED
jgi:hypothetical protein